MTFREAVSLSAIVSWRGLLRLKKKDKSYTSIFMSCIPSVNISGFPSLAKLRIEDMMTIANQGISTAIPLSASEERTWAMLVHLSVLINLFTGVLGPVV